MNTISSDSWRVCKLDFILERVLRPVLLDSSKTYRLAGVRLHGRGVHISKTVIGGELKTEKFDLVKAGDLTYNKMWTSKGAFGVVQPIHDGAIVTSEYPLFRVNGQIANLDFLLKVFNSPGFLKQTTALSKGSTSRARLNPGDFLKLKMLLPPLPEQRKIATILHSVDETLARTETIIAKLNAIKQQIIGQFLGSETYEQRQLNKILTLVKRPIEVDPQVTYREIGIRSHGKGIFHKAPVLGADFKKKAVYHIEPGDFVLNIVFAWEGAVALASDAEQGMVGSHRFPTFVINTEMCLPKYLLWYFKTGQGKHQLGLVSPGGAGRNKTLNQSKFLRLSIPLPPLAEQTRIIKSLEAIDQRIATEQAYLSQLERVKRGLMQKLLSGEIRVTP